jgi:hypothetical protein
MLEKTIMSLSKAVYFLLEKTIMSLSKAVYFHVSHNVSNTYSNIFITFLYGTHGTILHQGCENNSQVDVSHCIKDECTRKSKPPMSGHKFLL